MTTLEKTLIIECPHCKQLCEIVELNCCIFRCGIYKHNQEQIPPHLPKPACDALVNHNLIYGCGKPFQIVPREDAETKNTIYDVVICDYI